MNYSIYRPLVLPDLNFDNGWMDGWMMRQWRNQARWALWVGYHARLSACWSSVLKQTGIECIEQNIIKYERLNSIVQYNRYRCGLQEPI